MGSDNTWRQLIDENKHPTRGKKMTECRWLKGVTTRGGKPLFNNRSNPLSSPSQKDKSNAI